MSLKQAGTPFTGYVSLTSVVPSTLIPIYLATQGSASTVTLLSTDRLVLCTVQVSSNDTALDLVQITDNFTASPKILLSIYVTATLPAGMASFVPGIVAGSFGTNFKATTATITSGKTIEVNISGYIVRQN